MSKRKTNKTLIYVGPSMKDLKQYAVFTGKMFPAHIEKYRQDTIMKHLFIPMSDVSVFRKNLKTEGSREQQLFNKAVLHLEGGK